MKADAIQDLTSLEIWLTLRPDDLRPSESISIAYRAGLRLFPFWSGAMAEAWAQEKNLTALPILRRHLTYGVGSKVRSPELDFAAETANKIAGMLSVFASEADSSAFIHSDIFVENAGLYYMERLSYPDAPDGLVIFQEFRADAAKLEAGVDLINVPLWSDVPPTWFEKLDQKARDVWAEVPEHWSFWLRWWDGVLSGNQLDWDLQRQVALIPDPIWQQGPAVVAERIDLLIERLALKAEAAAIRSKLHDYGFNLQSLGKFTDNHPPPDDISPLELRSKLHRIAEALVDIEAALDDSEFEPEELRNVAQRLKDAWNALSLKSRIAIGAIVISVSGGFFAAMGDDLYHAAKSIDIPAYLARFEAMVGKSEPLLRTAPRAQ